MSEHTPGPWATYFVDPYSCVWVIRDDNKRFVAKMHEGFHDEELICRDELKANAHLIAAAPDLLAACEAVQRDIEGYIMGEWDGVVIDGNGNTEAWQALTDRLYAAIRKAKGKP